MGPADFDRLLALVAPFTEDVPLAKMTETTADPDLSFIAHKTGLDQKVVEQLAMAARFETFTNIPTWVWYALLRFANIKSTGVTPGAPSDFEARLSQALDSLMHSTVDALTTTLQTAINANAIAYHYLADIPAISTQLGAQIVVYAQSHPVTGEPSALLQKVQIGGLTGNDLQAFIEAKANHNGTEAEFWQKRGRPLYKAAPPKQVLYRPPCR